MKNEPPRVQDSDKLVQRQEFPLLGPYVAPRTATERKVAEIWRAALGMDQVGITDKFEELGGDSLLAMSIFADIEKSLAVAVPIAVLARSLTIEQLATRIDELMSGR